MPLLSAPSNVQVFPQSHDFRQMLGVVSLVPEVSTDDAEAVHVTGPDGFYCTRCLSQANTAGVVVRYPGDPEEVAAMSEYRASVLAANVGQ